MKIKTDKDNLIVEIPLSQDDYDAGDEYTGQIANVIGVIAKDEQGFCGLSSRTYKGKSPDITDFIVKTNMPDDDFEKLCKDLKVDFFRCPVCAYCQSVLWGTFSMKDGKIICDDCEKILK